LHNISNVDVNKYFRQKVSLLEGVSNVFSDNIMIYKLVDESKTIVENNMRLLNTEIRKSSNHEIKFIFEACKLKLNPLDVKIKNVVSLHTDNENYQSYIRSRVRQQQAVEESKPNVEFIAVYKISLSHFEIEKLQNCI